jgi:hypothetical protein
MLCGGILWLRSPAFRVSRPETKHAGGCGTGVMEGVMAILSFWMVSFMLLPLVGLGMLAFVLNRQQRGHHR